MTSQEKELKKRLDMIIDEISEVSDFLFRNKANFDKESKGKVDVSCIKDVKQLLSFVYMSGLNKNYTMLSFMKHDMIVSILDCGAINESFINMAILSKRHEYSIYDSNF